MCGGSPKIEAPKPAPPPPPPPPPQPPVVMSPLQTAVEPETTQAADRKRKGRDSLRIDLTSTAPASASGLNIPV
ncbi:hypothetical protein bb8_p39 [Bordetella phage vB_BbrP_BB8]|uniref:Uncharacterized protein n=1 Tax=Bordetella phage vB_BbrP_BB8 TaxID=2587820 RepID=A0A4Y5TNR4_9CAUD|nr:hypothetical protein bb8_p39 [Bordetella phage vB_BbrP_BB8]